MRWIALVVLVVGCGGRPMASPAPRPVGPSSCPSDHPLGAVADYVPPELPGFVISAPKLCARDEAYIRIERTAGARKLGTGRGKSGGFDEGCTKLPADPADLTQCPVINAGAILMAAHAELGRRKLEATGVGLGPCGDSGGDYAAWNFSASVYDWNDAEALVRIIAELLDRYDAAGYTGAAVRGIRCMVPA